MSHSIGIDDHYLTTPEGGAAFRDRILAATDDVLREQGQVLPMAWLLTRLDLDGSELDRVGILPVIAIGALTEELKTGYSEALSSLALSTRALGALLVLEVWDVRARGVDDADGIAQVRAAIAWREEHGSLAEFPGRQEVIAVTFEHVAIGLQHWRAPIVRDDAGRPSLGDWEQMPQGIAVGRFAHVLPPSAYGQTGTEA